MAFRGRGWGRGRGRGPSERIAKHVPYENFPEDVTLPSLPTVALTDELKSLLRWSGKLEDFWRGSCYHLQEEGPKSKSQDTEVERYSVKRHRAHEKREALAHYLKLTPSNFPFELIQGSKRVQHENKKLRWDRNSDDLNLDLFAKLEEKDKGRDDEKPEKKGENEDEDEVQEEEEEETSDEDDYNQNIDFDDDEDDMNMEEGEEEDAYD